MTARDPFPIGKYKGTPIGDIPQSYRTWALEQAWFVEKNPEIVAIWGGKEKEVSTVSEHEVLDSEAEIFKSMPPEFKTWWMSAYGTRMRQANGMTYIPFLRVAKEAWCACERRKSAVPKPAQPDLNEDVPF